MTRIRLLAPLFAVCLASSGICAASASALSVNWMKGYAEPNTPAKYNKVGVIKVGPRNAKNVLVLEPGTSAGGGYFVPLAKWVVAKTPGWQVWSVERRENLIEDQSELNKAKAGRATGRQLFDYYLGYLENSQVKRHFKLLDNHRVGFAKQWGMTVAVQDLHAVIGAARKLGGKVALGGHSLGGSVVTAYATWNFGGKPGADDLGGLVYIDGSGRPPESSDAARAALTTLNSDNASPWLSFGGIPSPFAGLYNATGSEGVLIDPNSPSLGQTFAALPAALKPKVRVTNLAEYGFALNVGTSPPSLIAAQAHLGRGVSPHGRIHGWDGRGALTPITRYATMFAGAGIKNVDGTEWYFPTRLTDDTGGVGSGLRNPAQQILGLRSTLGDQLPRRLLIYAFGAALGGAGVLAETRLLAQQSHIPSANLVLIDRHRTYAHNDPAGAFPHNVFFAHLVPFLNRVSAAR
ncbi:MAG: alpha/beta hydrolase [Solirubrobacteraceae bacterium]